MQFERDRLLASIDPHRSRTRGVVDALVLDDREFWVVVARHGEQIDDWMHGTDFEEVAPLLVCRRLPRNGGVVLDASDPLRDRLLSEIEDLY